jgi:hypothetical protein
LNETRDPRKKTGLLAFLKNLHFPQIASTFFRIGPPGDYYNYANFMKTGDKEICRS